LRILLVEDDALLAGGLLTALHRSHHIVEHVADGRMAACALRDNHFDMVILDLGLPGMDGSEVLRQARLQGDDTPVIILSARDASADRIQGLDLGADDYLVKPFELDELLARIRALERRRSGASGNRLQLGDLVLDLANFSVSWQNRPVELQRLEFMLLRQLLENPQRILSRDQLEEALYGWGEGVESNAIDVHIHHLRKKICPTVIKTIRGAGYRIGEVGA
jgi:DNA-binding response OmpR family regulator